MSFTKRLRTLTGHFRSLRGLAIAATTVLALGALLASGWFAAVLAAFAVLLAGFVGWLISVRISAQRSLIMRQRKRIDALERNLSNLSSSTAGSATGRFGPSARNRRVEEAERVRRGLVALSERLVGTVPQPHLEAASDPVSVAQSDVLVSVLVAVSDDEDGVEETLESLVRQGFSRWECIVVDDASVDGSARQVSRFTGIDKRVRLVRHRARRGVAAAWNTALLASSGRFSLPLRSGEVLQQGALLSLVESANDGSDGTCVGSATTASGASDGSPPAEVDYVGAVDLIGRAELMGLVDTGVLGGFGGFDESASGADRWRLLLRLLRRGFVLRSADGGLIADRPGRLDEPRLAAINELLDEADQVLDRDQVGPAGFAGSQGDYRTAIRKSELLVRSVLEDVVSLGDAQPMTRLATGIPPEIRRHVNVPALVSRELRRLVGSVEGSAANEQAMDALVDRLMQGAAFSDPPLPNLPESPAGDIVFLPQDAHQVATMAELIPGLPPGSSYRFVENDAMDGDQGTAEMLDRLGIAYTSAGEWLLAPQTPAQIVVAYPRSETVDAVCRAAAASGAQIVELEQASDAATRIDDAAAVLSTATTGTAGFATAIAGLRPEPGSGALERPDLRRMFARQLREEESGLEVDGEAMEALRDRYRGERCFIIGNGPSINQQDLSKMTDDFTVGVNGIFLAADRMGFDPTFYVVEDTMVVKDNLEEIKAYRAGQKFFPSIYRTMIGESPDTVYFNMNQGFYLANSPSFCVPRFSTDAAQRVYSGQSVTIINLQLAYHLGFSEVIMIGMDFSYTVPDDAEIDGNHITHMSDDPNHFHPDYFGKGKVWKDPKLDRVLASYQQAKLIYEANGRRILNATAGGKLELFERVDYDSLF